MSNWLIKLSQIQPRVMYHITTRENAEKILQEGFKTPSQMGQDPDHWDSVWMSAKRDASVALYRALKRMNSFQTHAEVIEWFKQKGVDEADLKKALEYYDRTVADFKERLPHRYEGKASPAGLYLELQWNFHPSSASFESTADMPWNEYLWSDFANKLVNKDVVMLQCLYVAGLSEEQEDRYKTYNEPDFEGIEAGMPIQHPQFLQDCKIVETPEV